MNRKRFYTLLVGILVLGLVALACDTVDKGIATKAPEPATETGAEASPPATETPRPVAPSPTVPSGPVRAAEVRV